MLSNSTITDPLKGLYGHLFSQNKVPDPQKLHVARQYGRHPSDSWASCQSRWKDPPYSAVGGLMQPQGPQVTYEKI